MKSDRGRRELGLRTRRRNEFIEITDQIREAVRAEGFTRGLVHCYIPHTTAAVTLNERIDTQVGDDLMAHLERLVPWTGQWSHPGNAAAHIKASLLGHAIVIAVEGGELSLGSWQGVFFCEFHGPRARKVWLTFQPAS